MHFSDIEVCSAQATALLADILRLVASEYLTLIGAILYIDQYYITLPESIWSCNTPLYGNICSLLKDSNGINR